MRVVSAGIPRAIAQRPLLLGALTLTALLAVPAPASATATDALGTLPPQATQAAAGALTPAAEPVRQAVTAGGQAVDSARPAAEPARQAAGSLRRVTETATSAAGAGEGGGPLGAVSGGSERGSPLGAASDDPVGAVQADPVRAVDTAAGELSRSVPPPGALPAAPLGDALRALGDTLRGLVPVDAVAPLLGGAALGELARTAIGDLPAPDAPGALPPGARTPSPAGGDSLGARVWGHVAPVVQPGALTSLQPSSAQPPAAEIGGRPGSPSPRKAPAPAAGGTAAPAPGGFFFAPFLALLVLAALVAPRLLRRLDAVPAFLRPALFVCALERPG